MDEWAELTAAELMIASLVGSMRRVGSLKRRMDTDRHAPHSSWATDIDGAAAEMVVSRTLGRYWSGHTNNFNGDDVSGNIQVRSTSHLNGCLIVRESDKDDARMVLVVVAAPRYSIRGWIAAGDAKQEAFFRAGGDSGSDAWWVPQPSLRNLSEIAA